MNRKRKEQKEEKEPEKEEKGKGPGLTKGTWQVAGWGNWHTHNCRWSRAHNTSEQSGAGSGGMRQSSATYGTATKLWRAKVLTETD